MTVYGAAFANEAWKQAARELLAEAGNDVQSRLGRTREMLHTLFRISDPRQRWVVARLPSMNPAFALAEVVWILSGRNDTSFLAHWFPRYPSYVGGDQQQYGAYGQRLRSESGLDQIVRAYEALRSNPASRQVVLQIWSAGLDLPTSDGGPRSGDVPCNLVSCLKVRGNRLYWLQVSRSGDLDRGLPHNIVQFTFLHELFAGWLGLEVGEYVHVVDSLHWYVDSSSRLRIDEEVVPAPNTDRLHGSLEESLSAFERLATGMDNLVAGAPSERTLGLPKEYENIYRIVAADSERRSGRLADASRLIADCDNPAYVQLWDRWITRVSSRQASSRRKGRTPDTPVKVL